MNEVKEKRLDSVIGNLINTRGYNVTIGMIVLLGVLINIVMVQFLNEQICSMPYWEVIVLYFAGSLIPLFIMRGAKSGTVGIICFGMLSISMGLLVTYYLQYFDVGSALLAFVTTGAVTALMILLSTIYPTFFERLGITLFVTLVVTLISEIIFSLILGIGTTLFDYIFVVVFCGYIGYDWYMAQRYPKTINNAIWSATDIYIDVVNLFMRLLSIIGKRK